LKPLRLDNQLNHILFETPGETSVLKASVRKFAPVNTALITFIDQEMSRLATGEQREHPTTSDSGTIISGIAVPAEYAGDVIPAIVYAANLKPSTAERIGVNSGLARTMIDEYWKSCDLSAS